MSQPGRLRLYSRFSILAIFAMIIAACSSAAAPAPRATVDDLPATPGRATDGTLKMIYWQAVSLLNPYLSSGNKDWHAASLILEPLMWSDPGGLPVPALAAEVPTLKNGGISEDLVTITYSLKDDVLWSDGTPFTADDVVFTWQYCTNPEMPCTTIPNFEGVTNVEAVDSLKVKITFDAPKAFPYGPFNGMHSPIIQKAQFTDCVGAKAQECSAVNTAPIGTGPYMVKDFRANDIVTYEANPNFRIADQPHFAEISLKGGGDAAAAARAVLETGEVDWSWLLQVEPAILNPMAEMGVGTVYTSFGGSVERIVINFTNPDPALGENRSNWMPDGSTAHPFLNDINVRKALSIAIDRNIIAKQLYGFAGKATCNIVAGPPAVASTANDACLTQDIEGARKLLEENGWVDSNGDGVREKDGVELRILYATATNAVRQKTQALVQQWWQEVGVATDLKNVDAGVFFGADPASPDTLNKFYADVQMFSNGPDTNDPQTYLTGWLCGPNGENIVQRSNQFNAQNSERWCSPAYDALFAEYAATKEPAARADLAKQLNDMIVQNYVNLPLIFRGDVSGASNTVAGIRMNSWDSQLWNIGEWHRIR